MTPDQLETIRMLGRGYRITPSGRQPSNEWPIAHAGLFASVRKLGDSKYRIYAKSKENSSPDEPWGASIIDRADRVVEISERSQRKCQNEAKWRLALEHEVFSSFTVEVACRKCRARLWRSEIGVNIESHNLDGSSLEQRQKRRTPCQCPSRSRQHDINDGGLEALFSYRAEELVEHKASTRLALARQEHPDRIYGLRETGDLVKALYSPFNKYIRAAGGPVLLNEALRVSPFERIGEPLLFPFLVFQAESAKTKDFESIDKQTAPSIQTLLKMQADLQEECEQRKNWQEGPLVWFLSNGGEDWRLAACSVDIAKGEASYSMFNFWNGELITKDGALQLLLIIDRVFDWARDTYRLAIIRHLEYLSSSDANRRFDSSPSSPTSNSNTRSSSTAGARRRELRNHPAEDKGRHKSRDYEPKDNPLRGKSLRRGRVIVDMTKNGGPEVRAEINHLPARD